MLREAESIAPSYKAPVRTSPRVQKGKRKMMGDDSDDELHADETESNVHHDGSGARPLQDVVAKEVEAWKHLPRERYSKYKEGDDDVLNEFWMMWDLRKEFPLHFIVFKQCASHLHHEANVEQVFSLAKRLSDPNLDPCQLAGMVRTAFNKRAWMPSIDAIRARYFQDYRKCGADADGEDEE